MVNIIIFQYVFRFSTISAGLSNASMATGSKQSDDKFSHSTLKLTFKNPFDFNISLSMTNSKNKIKPAIYHICYA